MQEAWLGKLIVLSLKLFFSISKMKVLFNNIEFEISTEILKKSEYFNFLIEHLSENQNKIIINNQNLSILGFKYILNVLQEKKQEYNPKYEKELEYFELNKKSKYINRTDKKIPIIFNGLQIEIEKEILLNATYFESKINRWSSNEIEPIIINQSDISLNGFFYVLDLLTGREENYKPEYKVELNYFGIDFETEETEEYDILTKEKTKNYKNIITQKLSSFSNRIFCSNPMLPALEENITEQINDSKKLSTNFDTEHHQYTMGINELEFDNNNSNFGMTYRLDQINRSCDVITEHIVQIKLPALPKKYIWIEKVGLEIIKRIRLFFKSENNNIEIFNFSRNFLKAEYEVYTPETKKSPELIFDLPLKERIELSKHPITLMIPIHFIRPNIKDQNETIKRGFPLIAQQFENHRIECEIEHYDKLIEKIGYTTDSIPPLHLEEITLHFNCIWAENEIRQHIAQNPQEIAINQVQEQLNEFRNEKVLTIPLEFTKHCKDLIIIIKNLKTEEQEDSIQSIELKTDNRTIISVESILPKIFFPRKYLGKTIPKGYYYIPFCSEPYNSFTGTINFGTLPNKNLIITTHEESDYEINVLTTNINRLDIAGGRSTLLHN